MSVIFNAGDLRRRLTIQQRDTAQDALGGQLVTWRDVVAVWGSIVPLSGRELELAQARYSEVTHAVSIRYRAEFADPKAAAAYRLLYGSRILNIHGALNIDERNRLIELAASEGLNDG